MTEQEKQTRRARRAQERKAGVVAQDGAAAKTSELSPQAIKERSQHLRDQAARKRAKRKAKGRSVAAEELATAERIDDVLPRSAHATTKFVQRNLGWLQWVFVFGAAGAIGYLIYEHRTELAKEKAGDALMSAVAAQHGNVTGRGDWRSPDRNLIDPRLEFASDEERLKATEERYRTALGAPSNEGSRLYAHLGLAGVLFDQGRYADARAEYENAKNNPLADKMPEAKGRALEGLALSFEAEGKRDQALSTLTELERVEGFRETAHYHRARLWHAQGESQKALEELKKLQDDLVKSAAPGAQPGFLQLSVMELLRTLDPNATPPEPPSAGISPEQLEELQRQFEEMQRQGQIPQDVPLDLPLGPAPTDSEPSSAEEASDEEPAPEAPSAPQAPASKAPAPQAPAAPKAPAPQASAPAAPSKPAEPAPAETPPATPQAPPAAETPPPAQPPAQPEPVAPPAAEAP